VDIADAWAQHPTPRHVGDPIFDSLKRWTRSESDQPVADIPVSVTSDAMDRGGVFQSLISAWYAPRNVVISSDEASMSRAASLASRSVRRSDTRVQLVEYMKRNGKNKVLFATNFPMISPEKALSGIEQLGLRDECVAAFLAGNARRVFKLQAGAS
jgi:hypothetical protein